MSATYQRLLERLDAWFAAVRADVGDTIPCRSGCRACCHGPFDVSVADVALLREGLGGLPAPIRSQVERRAHGLLDLVRALEPAWSAPHEIAVIGEERFDRLSDALAAEPCPLLDAAGHCLAYAERPLVCRRRGRSHVADG